MRILALQLAIWSIMSAAHFFGPWGLLRDLGFSAGKPGEDGGGGRSGRPLPSRNTLFSRELAGSVTKKKHTHTGMAWTSRDTSVLGILGIPNNLISHGDGGRGAGGGEYRGIQLTEEQVAAFLAADADGDGVDESPHIA